MAGIAEVVIWGNSIVAFGEGGGKSRRHQAGLWVENAAARFWKG